MNHTESGALRLGDFIGKRVAVGLSGGVDSSLVAALLVDAGAMVTGITMKIWREGALPVTPGSGDACYGPGEEEDVAACVELCRSLGIPYHALDLAAEYERRVLDYFREEYRRGRTPNPCVRCNRDMKFGFLLERAREAGAEFEIFATGHYARIERREGLPRLRTAVDAAKDQSYFIHRLTPEILSRVAFPLGSLTKAQTRELARKFGLASADKPESQDFIPGGYAAAFGDEEPGDIVDASGKVLGRHRGLAHYTIGQRRGIGVSAGPEPVYVSALDPATNRVVVSSDASLFATGLVGLDAFLVGPAPTGNPVRALVRIRQNHRPAPASVSLDGERATVQFDDPQRAVAPGQSAVFYDAEGFVLGGCVIESAVKQPLA